MTGQRIAGLSCVGFCDSRVSSIIQGEGRLHSNVYVIIVNEFFEVGLHFLLTNVAVL